MTPKGKRVLFFEREVKVCYKSLMGDSCEGGYGIKLGPGWETTFVSGEADIALGGKEGGETSSSKGLISLWSVTVVLFFFSCLSLSYSFFCCLQLRPGLLFLLPLALT